MTTKVAKPLQEHVTRQALGEPERPPAPDVREVIPLFVGTRFRAAKTTHEKYRRELRAFADWCQAQRFPTDTYSLSGKRGGKYLIAYLQHMEQEGKAATSQLTAYRCLKTFWRWCLEESTDDNDEPGQEPYYVRRAPTDLPEVKAALPADEVADDVGEPYTDVEVERILEAIGSQRGDFWTLRDRAMIQMLSHSGLRRKEVVNLKVSDYHPADGTITVRNTVAKSTKRRDDSRTTKVYNDAHREINRYYMILTGDRQRAKGRGNPSDPLFPSRHSGKDSGKHLTNNAVGHWFVKLVQGIQAACKHAVRHEPGTGCDKCIRFGADLHRFRATWAINMKRRGVDLDDIMKMGGWSSPDMPMRYMRKALGELAVARADRAMREG